MSPPEHSVGGGASWHGHAGGRWRLRNWRLRTKLLVAVLIPTLAVLALVSLRVRTDLGQAGRLAELATRVRLDQVVTDVTHQLERERDLTVRFVAGDRASNPTELRTQRSRVDNDIGRLARSYARTEDQLAEPDAGSLRHAQGELEVLTGLRYAGEHSALPADAIMRSYSGLISRLLDESDQSVTRVFHAELGSLRLAANALSRIEAHISTKRAVLAQALELNRLSGDRMRALLGADAELAAARNDFDKFATPQQKRGYDDTVIGLVVDIGNNMVESALTRAESGQPLTGLAPEQWDVASTYTANLVHRVQDSLFTTLRERTDSLAAQARNDALRDTGMVFAVLLVGAGLAVTVARSLLRPLRTLRANALEVAEYRLPAAVEGIFAGQLRGWQGSAAGVAAVPVFSREELGELARAFDAVHGEAVRLAGEQALLRDNVNAMFVNLSSRSQDLVERQLAVLESMEASEQDPNTLGGLFELDHLATRMRRNSENLLVLSGHDLATSMSGPVAVDEIIGAAISEVEHYPRVEVGALPALAVRGDAVADLVHMISELLENATRYSEPNTPVLVTSSVTDGRGWRVDITDSGPGMPDTEIARMNARLAKPPEVDLEVSRRMGLYVVAVLARRHHVQVRLFPAPRPGVTATITVPAGIMRPGPARPALGQVVEQANAAPAPTSTQEPTPAPVGDTPPSGHAPTQESSPPELVEPAPPRRAPVEESVPDWPTEQDNARPLDIDAPTERMPAYQDVLSRWFKFAATDSAERTAPAEPEASAGATADWGSELPKRVPRAQLPDERAHPLASGPEEAVASPAFFTHGASPISRTPEQVRMRMSKLQHGIDHGRSVLAAHDGRPGRGSTGFPSSPGSPEDTQGSLGFSDDADAPRST